MVQSTWAVIRGGRIELLEPVTLPEGKLQIPDSVVQAIRLPEERVDQELRVELAIALYAQGLLSFGKARELAEKGKYEAVW
jgi:hypothetical protein